MRARLPDDEGYVARDGIKVFYEVAGAGNEPTLLLLPAWSFVHSRIWKAQVPFLARHYRVVTFDPRGNGRSDRPDAAAAYAPAEIVEDGVAVLDEVGADRAVLVGVSMGGLYAVALAAAHPERVTGAVLAAPATPFGEVPLYRSGDFDLERDSHEGWDKFNRLHWLSDYRDFVEFFASRAVTEPHSTKQHEDFVAWAMETTPETLAATVDGRGPADAPGLAEIVRGMCEAVRCPVLVVHGDGDEVVPLHWGEGATAATRGDLVVFEGSGHTIPAREPVRFNLLVRDFVERLHPKPPETRRWRRASVRRKRALFLSSPIGLGHARRDVAIADELRRHHPDLEVDWLTQHPVARLLEDRGERVHPASTWLASESAHIESESAGHDLHCFEAYRRMDEILVANFMVFHDVLTGEHYDIVVGDEAWDVDHFLHENPELKQAPLAWLTDFVGFLPTAGGGDREVALTADYNAEMVEHVARYAALRDRSIFVGNPGDIVPDRLGPGMPTIREWTEANFDFAGYVSGFDPDALGDREALRDELGFGEGEIVCVATVGGSAVGAGLLDRVVTAFGPARDLIPGLRMVVVTGPRLDPEALGLDTGAEGLDVRTYVPDLYKHLSACDIAVVQGGLTTAMELTATRRPFLYFPLEHHFEQERHVRHRLERYGAGRRMQYSESPPEVVAEAMAAELARPREYLPVESDGAARAGAMIAELL